MSNLKRIKNYSLNSKQGIITSIDLELDSNVTVNFRKQNNFHLIQFSIHQFEVKLLDADLLLLQNRDMLITYILNLYDNYSHKMN